MFDFSRFKSLDSLYCYFTTDAICRKAIEASVWEDGEAVCPFCGEKHCYSRGDGRYKCAKCGKSFSCLHGTIFDNTKIPLRKWFATMFLVATHKSGISSYGIARSVEVSQKTAWFMLSKIRTLFKQNDALVLRGDVEMDEAFIGGCEMNKHFSKKTPKNQGRSLKTKSPVIGMVERGGSVVAIKTDNCTADNIKVLVRQFVEADSTIFTDTHSGYKWLDNSEYFHATCIHSKGYAGCDGNNTNSIENFWVMMRRALFCIYIKVSVQHLQSYIDEVAFRYNTRKMSNQDRFKAMMDMSLHIVRYADVKVQKMLA